MESSHQLRQVEGERVVFLNVPDQNALSQFGFCFAPHRASEEPTKLSAEYAQHVGRFVVRLSFFFLAVLELFSQSTQT